ncbi:MAG: hypothetical protein ISR96_03585 [Nitrospira sp.]|nr:hypothetical protein [bacterium]MBL7048597.1 hypothetical protein [Nitrospira sp.]
MKKILSITAVIMVMAAFFVAAPVKAEEGPAVSGSAGADFMSHYIWRGQRLSDGFVIQPTVGITYGGFGANIWSNWDDTVAGLTDGGVTETDYTLNYTFAKDKFGFDIGLIFYTFKGGGDTQEVYAAVSYDTLLSPSVAVYWDFDEGDGGFISASIGHSLPLPGGMALDLGASASMNLDHAYLGTDSAGKTFTDLYNADIKASMTIPVTKNISVTPMVAASMSLSDDAEAALKGLDATGQADDSYVYGGVNLSLSF